MIESAPLAESAATVGQVGLAEAGNLGDDLILIAAVRAIGSALPRARVRFVSHGLPLDWARVYDRLPFTADLEPVQAGRGLRQMVQAPSLLGECSAIVFGGGGLIQTSHHPFRPYHWLRYLGVGQSHPPAIAVGLGIGPLDGAWMRRLKRGPRFFEECWLRDDASVQIAREIGWDARRCSDFVDAEFLSGLGLTHRSCADSGPLGVALRAWPGLAVSDVARHIEKIASERAIGHVEFFVLESKSGSGPDVEFTREVARNLRLANESSVYQSGNLFELLDRMAACSSAISMKLHASAVWNFTGATTYPIIYAPKVAAHFGLPYKGLEILTKAAEQDASWESDAIPTAASVVGSWLQNAVGARAHEKALRIRQHAELAARSLASEARRRARTLVGAG